MRIKLWPGALSVFAILIFGAGPAPALDAAPDSVSVWTDTCRTVIDKLAKGLKSKLIAAMKTGGPVEALQVCNLQAIPITEKISREEGIRVARTSLRVRNPKNMPDAWETKILERFDAQKADGAATTSLTAWTIVADADSQRTFRYMKAIPTVRMCLKCHGEDLSPDVTEALEELYPADLATGFRAGELRGAFTVHFPIDRGD